MLEHVSCPRCGAPNLTTDYVCFACGARLRPIRKRIRPRPSHVPWPFWVGLALALAVLGLGAWKTTEWLSSYRQQKRSPVSHWLLAGGALLVAGQAAFYRARRTDRRRWRLARAPELPLRQAHAGDVIWARGRIECDTPLIAPYCEEPCVYYHLVIKERDSSEAPWRTVRRETRSVDFTVSQDDASVRIPTGGVLFEAPIWSDTYPDGSADLHVRVWALALGVPAGIWGKVANEGNRLRLDPPADDLPVVATWQSPQQYVASLARRATGMQIVGWAASLAGALVLMAAVAQAP